MDRSFTGDQSAKEETHRGGFGEFGGEERGLIDRSFRERIVLAGVSLEGVDKEITESSLEELERLVDTAGADAVAVIIQNRQAPDKATFVGSGKAQEIRSISEEFDADTVVFDNELTPAQQSNLEGILKRSALDRTAVILDIFAQNANSLEGKAQVELAQLRYRLPRLRKSGRTFSQQAGGIGTRGPGETQLEVDRRRLMRRIRRLEQDLNNLRRHRSTQSKARSKTSNRSVAIVGYTNAGKSTLLNRLTDAGVLVEDRLFATLDTTTRRMQLPGGEAVYLTDTVGFVRKLPHQLVEAFKATLDVVVDADLLLHVIDASDPDPEGCIEAVRQVLEAIGASEVPELMVFNKIDKSDGVDKRLLKRDENCVAVSASTGQGIDELVNELASSLRKSEETITLKVPFERGDIRAMAHREGFVIREVLEESNWLIEVRADESSIGRLEQFEIDFDLQSLN
ncbi:MAG: GTPase HflX [Acidimicrobiales bacterium]|jgi:GTP-binding protein HflX|nr:GTPase HflX [Acidimicrobiales bacterium]MDP6895100.1 GTPase HflX [Acidimicrobiales bacterium]HJM38116.1 GTPase HflX [Acidimicrobiales bacterium]